MLSIIIPTLNEEGNIEDCLSSISSQCLRSSRYEVLIIDGNSVDRTIEKAKGWKEELNLRIFRAKANIGKARDIGVKQSKGSIIFSTDADARLETRGHLKKIVKDFSEKDIVCWSGSVHDPNFALQTFILSEMLKGETGVCGANFAFKKTAYEEVGGFPPFEVAEDMILYVKLRSKYPTKHIYRGKYGVEMMFNPFKWAANTHRLFFG